MSDALKHAVTLGVDLSAQPKKTAACRIVWSNGRAEVDIIELGIDDQRLVDLATQADKTGIDVPFGWPEEFVRAVSMHQAFEGWPDIDTRRLRLRRTDFYVREATGIWPLSVSTNFLGITAMRGARLLREERDRIGEGRFVEVYPRAAMIRFGISSLDELLGSAQWLTMRPEAVEACRVSDDCFDSLIAGLVTRAALLRLCDAIPVADRRAAEHEGWIALPVEGALSRLAGMASAERG
jgi:predicted nuclease with RNAse H fold